MDNHLFGFIATAVLLGFIFGWKGVLAVILWGVVAACQPRQKKKSKLLSSIEKLGE